MRSLRIWNGLWNRPTRVWRKKILPFESKRIAIAAANRIGAVAMSAAIEITKSNARLLKRSNSVIPSRSSKISTVERIARW